MFSGPRPLMLSILLLLSSYHVFGWSGSNDSGKSPLMNPRYTEVDYAVRGPIVTRALELAGKLEKGEKLPFDKIVFTNIGNPHALGQAPISFYREVLSGVLNPSITSMYKPDVVKRVRKILAGAAGSSIGAYTHSQGLSVIRESVATFLQNRDGMPSDINNIFLTNGASAGASALMGALLWTKKHGALIPIPQYPLYTATTALLGGTVVPYYLTEEKGWGVSASAVKDAISKAKADGIEIKLMVIINPGNPSGNHVSVEDITAIIELALAENFVIMADEVYQKNIYLDGAKFTSFRKVLWDLMTKNPGKYDDVKLVSLDSTSKGLIGECGLRGGYFELHGFPTQFRDSLLKLASVSLCPNTMGQVATELLVNPPKPGDESYDIFQQESDALFGSLKRRAAMMSKALSGIKGVESQEIAGALYAFPRIFLPTCFVDRATKNEEKPDALYCKLMLEETGIVTVPGSGFRQKDGTFHFRITILPKEEDMPMILEALRKFHETLEEEHCKGSKGEL